MDNGSQPNGIKRATGFVGAFIIMAAAAGLLAGVLTAAILPGSPEIVAASSAVAGIVGGGAGVSIPPVRDFIARIKDFFLGW